MKKVIALLLCGLLLFGCSKIDSQNNRTREMTDDLQNGINDFSNDLEKGANDIKEEYNDIKDEMTKENDSTMNRNISDSEQYSNLINVPSYRNATLGHPFTQY